MKTWQIVCSILLIVLLVHVICVPNQNAFDPPIACCLCNPVRFHAPCLVDLETGSVTELSVYDPHPTISGELAEEQYTTGTFSFVTCGEAQGYRNTTQKKVEITVPDTELTGRTVLCAECQKRCFIDFENRYILMDLYEKEKAHCIPMVTQAILIRCYEVTISNHERGMTVTINGTIETE